MFSTVCIKTKHCSLFYRAPPQWVVLVCICTNSCSEKLWIDEYLLKSNNCCGYYMYRHLSKMTGATSNQWASWLLWITEEHGQQRPLSIEAFNKQAVTNWAVCHDKARQSIQHTMISLPVEVTCTDNHLAANLWSGHFYSCRQIALGISMKHWVW